MNPAVEHKTCLLCFRELPVPTVRLYDDAASVQCQTCGDYGITADAFLLLMNSMGEEKRYLLSGRARMSSIETGVRHRFDAREIEAMKKGQLRDKTFGESMLSVMRWLAAAPPGRVVKLRADLDHPVAYCRDFAELKFVVTEIGKAGYVSVHFTSHALDVQLAGRGWQWLEERLKEGTGPQAFIAMSFSDAMAEAEAALIAGVRTAGYDPILVKYREFSDGIADRIFAEIRRSHFVVADFTENKAGVYYEAGFAQGLGLRVIGTCEVGHLDPKNTEKYLHFDVRALNMIAWRRDNLADLTERLTQRIRAMLGQGPIKAEAQVDDTRKIVAS